MSEAGLIIYNIGSLYTCAGESPRRGTALRQLPSLSDAALASFDGRIVYAGPESDLNGALDETPQVVAIDAKGRAVLPGFIDPHTHVVYAGERLGEFRERLAGASYLEIAARGGGILSTVRKTREASLEELVESSRARLDRMLLNGTTTAEAKSGYGLTTESEMRMLEAIDRLNRSHPIDLVPTFLGAHEVPPEYRDKRASYVELLLSEMIPEVGRSGLAEWCDVFCEVGVYSVEESRRILSAALEHGMKLRIHADEFADTGGTRLAVELGARSADHLIKVSPEGIQALARSETMATLLPAASFYLKQYYAPARALIDGGVAVALATDLNPGGGHSPSMPFTVSLACLAAGMTLEEAILAATVNAAFSIDRWDNVGSLEVGKKMDAVVLTGQDPACLLQIGTSSIDTVVKAGKVVVEGGRVVRESAKKAKKKEDVPGPA
jgi:imidazolonepropionase